MLEMKVKSEFATPTSIEWEIWLGEDGPAYTNVDLDRNEVLNERQTRNLKRLRGVTGEISGALEWFSKRQPEVIQCQVLDRGCTNLLEPYNGTQEWDACDGMHRNGGHLLTWMESGLV